MSFELLQICRDLQARVGVLEEQVKQLMLAQRKTISLPPKPVQKSN